MSTPTIDTYAADLFDWRPLVKQWKIGVAIALLIFGSACTVISQIAPLYKAHVQILLPLKLVESPDDRKAASPQQADAFVVKSFTDLVTDDGLSRKVIKELKLADDPEFQPRNNWFTDAVAQLSKYLSGAEVGSSLFSAEELNDDRVLQTYNGRLKAVSEGKDLTILLSFEAQDPHLAERIVTTHARAFIHGEIDHRRSDYDAKVRWMKLELDRTAAAARDAQVAIQLNPTALALSRNVSASAVSDLKMRQLEATGTQAVYDSVLKRYQDMVADQSYVGSEIRILSEATLPTHPYFPKKLLSAAVAGLVSLVFGFFAAGVASVVRKKIGAETLAEMLELPVLARVSIPRIFWSGFGPRARAKRTLFWQRVHALRSTINVTGKRHPITLVTSLLPKEGKTLVASALARSMACSGLRTLLVDLNGRNTRYQLSLDGQCPSPLSLQDYLEGAATARQVAVQVDRESPLFLMTSRDAKATEVATLSGAKLRTKFSALKKDFDAIVIDAPALEGISDVFQVASYTDEILLTVLAGNQQLEKLSEDIAKLRARSAHVKGVVIVERGEPDSEELAHTKGYALSDPLREIWPKFRARRSVDRGWVPKLFGKATTGDERAEASI